MKISREIKIGLLGIITIVSAIWGYKFLQGQNLLTSSYKFYSKFENVDQLTVSSPVLVSGYQVGNVTSIELDETDMTTIVVEIDVENKFRVPKNTIIELFGNGLMGSKALRLVMNAPCTGTDCAESGAYFENRTIGFIDGFVGEGGLDASLDKLRNTVGSVFDTLNTKLADPANEGRISSLLKNVDELSGALIQTTKNVNSLVYNTNKNLNTISKGMDGILENLNKNNEAIQAIINNSAGITKQLNSSDLKGTVTNLNGTMTTANSALAQMDITLKKLEEVSTSLASVMKKLDKGEGNMGKMVNDKALYENLTKMTENMDLLLEDLRIHPKRYFSVLRRKEIKYEAPIK